MRTATPRTLALLGLLLPATGIAVRDAAAGEQEPDGRTGDQMWDDWCAIQQPFHYRMKLLREELSPRGYPSRDAYVVCADASGAGVMTGPSTWNRLDFPLPNSAILLLVHGNVDVPITWRLTAGTRGWTAAGVDMLTAPGDKADDEQIVQGSVGVDAETKNAAIANEAATLLPRDQPIADARNEQQQDPIAGVGAVVRAIDAARGSATLEQRARLDALIERALATTATSVVNLHRFQPGTVGVELTVDPAAPSALVARLDTLRVRVASLAEDLDTAATAAKGKTTDAKTGAGWRELEDQLRDTSRDLAGADQRLQDARNELAKRDSVGGADAADQQRRIDAVATKVNAVAPLEGTVQASTKPSAAPNFDRAPVESVIEAIDELVVALSGMPDPTQIELPALVV